MRFTFQSIGAAISNRVSSSLRVRTLFTPMKTASAKRVLVSLRLGPGSIDYAVKKLRTN